MAPKRSCKGKKRSKKCSRRKRSCPKKPSLFIDDIRYMQFKKAAQEAVQSSINDSFDEYEIKISALDLAWNNFYKSVNLEYITPQFLIEASKELDMILIPLFQEKPDKINRTYILNSISLPVYPYKTASIIAALTALASPTTIV